MEYGVNIYEEAPICDMSYMRHVGYKENNGCIRKYFSKDNVDLISYKITQLLMGVDPQNRPIIVPDKTICSVMSDIYNGFRPPTGDIYGRYNIPNGMDSESYVQDMIDQTIEIIVSDVSNNLGIEENNKKLTIWNTVLGDFNINGLRSHSAIKVLNKRPQPMQFFENY